MDRELTIVYVEDDPGSRKVMRMMLRGMMGVTNLNIYEDSTDFFSRVQALMPQPTLFLLDIHVTPDDGFTMLKRLRESDTFRTTPVIALTASVMNEEIQQLKTAGFDGVIAKPINVDTFPALLERILKGEHVWAVMK